MNRIEVIEKLLKATHATTYLEIGVRYGTIFLPLKVKRKIAVDPHFAIPLARRLLHPFNLFQAKYYAETSDDFFARHSDLFATEKIDVAFIDGLHTYEQSLKDVENCLKHLSPRGVIIMHDCNPPSAAAALPTMAESLAVPGNKAWCGDVWKTIVRLRSTRPDLDVSVLDTDYGLGIVRWGRAEHMLPNSPETIAAFGYAELEKDRAHLLNLKPASHLADICRFLRHE